MRSEVSGNRAGFTMVELLISAGLIAVLAGLLVPALMEARATARRTSCQSHLKQWALATHFYAEVHRGRLPYRGQGIRPTFGLNSPNDWFNALAPLIDEPPYSELVATAKRPKPGEGSIWICPEAEPLDPLPAKPFDPETFFAYGMNMALSTPYDGPPGHIEKVGPRQTMVFMADGLGSHCSVLPHWDRFSPVARHVGSTVNIAFLDGRVEAFPGEEVGCGIGDPKRPDIRWYPPNTRWPGPPY